MGGYHSAADQAIQEIAPLLPAYDQGPMCSNPGSECGVWGAPTWWTTTSGTATGYAYWGGKGLPIRQFTFYPTLSGGTSAGFIPSSLSGPWPQTRHVFYGLGTTPAVSWGANNTSAVLWAIDSSQGSAGGVPRLYAFDALSLSCLYATVSVNGDTCTRVDAASAPMGIALYFTVPTVANGQVLVGAGSYLTVFGVK